MADTRVTQAGRQAAIQPAADVRVTQAGRQAAIQPAADMRVTQAGRQAAILVDTGDLRVTMMGRQVLMPKPTPTATLLINPENGETYALQINVLYTESTDPLGGTITYTFQYKTTASGTWLTEFTGRSGTDPYVWDISGLADGDYNVRIYATATGGTGEDSAISTATITVDNTTPGPPSITAPYAGQEWVAKNSQRVEWTAATDPNDLPLTYKIDYRAVGAGSWTPVTSGLTTLYYDWDISAFVADDYEVRVYANNGTVDGLTDVVQFVVTAADRPITPTIIVTGISDNCFTVEAAEYDHPTPRAWASTTYQIIPWDGDFANPMREYTTTDPDEQLKYTFCDLPPGFLGLVRIKFTDNAANDSLWSGEATFNIADVSRAFVQRWETDAVWSGGGVGEAVGQNWDYQSAGFNPAQNLAAAVLRDVEPVGSVFVSGYVMLDGCNCGWIGRDTELRQLGVGIFEGYRDDATMEGVSAHLDSGITNSAFSEPAAMFSTYLVIQTYWGGGLLDYSYTSVDVGGMLARLQAGYTNETGIPIGNWTTDQNRDPWYKIEMQVNRDLTVGSETTRIRARVFPASAGPGMVGVTDPLEGVPDGDWHIDVTYNRVGPCGKPGYVFGQAGSGFIVTARTHFRGLDFVSLRDDGLPTASNLTAPLYTEPAGPGACTPQSETALPTPVFFPVPPNGEVTERPEYPTDIIGAWDDTEQRISLRGTPRTVVGWTGTMPSSKEATDIAALIYDQQPSRWIVPMWMDAAPLLADLAAFSGTIPAASVDTLDRRFEEMTHVALWVDQFTYHVTTATLQDDGSIFMDSANPEAFTGGAKGPTFVLPCRVGRMPQRLEAPRRAPFISEADFEFILEGVTTDG